MVRTISMPTVRRRRAGAAGLVLALAAGLIPLVSVTAAEEPADAVIAWNFNAVSALSNMNTAPFPGAGLPPPASPILLAMVEAAVYDAVNAIDGGHEPYLHGLPPASSTASKSAAAATAAHHVLNGLTPALPQNVRDYLDGLYLQTLAGITPGADKDAGVGIGAAVAMAMLIDRAGDGRFGTNFTFHPGFEAGEWRPELPAGATDPFAWVSNVRTFALNDASQVRTKGPYDLKSRKYASDYDEVVAMGRDTGSSRTPDQTTQALFFAANPLVMQNRALREIATARGLSAVDAARLFGMSSVAAADAFIGCWDDKDYWSFWRPITAIREAASDGNKRTDPVAGWLPLLATPPYPDHPSGYNCYTAAMMHSAKRFFHTDRVSFVLTTPAGATRSYDRFTAVLKDTIDARIWLGIHFRNPDIQGATLGKTVAKWVDRHYFRAVD